MAPLVTTPSRSLQNVLVGRDTGDGSGQSFRFAKRTFDKVTRETIQEDLDREATLTNSSDSLADKRNDEASSDDQGAKQ